jgi:membrane dipeptidase
MRRGGVAIGLGTILVRANPSKRPTKKIDLDVASQNVACAMGRGQLAYYRVLEDQGELRFIATQQQLKTHFSQWQSADDAQRQKLPVGLILAMEGADPIVSPAQAQAWWNDGLRVVGLAHYGKSHYAVGTGDAGPLTEAGVELLREFERLGMILDLTHCSDPSFFQAIDQFPGPVLASHNNCRALVPGDRQYSDEQIKLLIDRGAIIGAALDAWMLKPGYLLGKTPSSEVPLTNVVDHIDHICQIAGNTNHVGIGSDLDGGFGTEQTPDGIETIADMQRLAPLLKERGYGEDDIDRIFHGNWLRFFTKALPAT